jgi:polysaccharide pyruvyl transferase WcaK-like protein
MRLALSAWAGMGNIGDDWLLSTAMDLGGADVSAVVLEPDAEVPHWIDPTIPVHRWPRLGAGFRAVDEVAEFRRGLRRHSDGLLYCGGGWLAGDQGNRTPARWALRTRLVPVPAAGFGLGVGPFAGRIQQVLARAAVRSMSGISVRSQSDADWVEVLTGRRPSVIGDPTFSLAVDEGIAETGSGVAVVMPAPFPHWLSEGEADRYAEGVMGLAEEVARGQSVAYFAFDRHSDVPFWSRYVSVTAPPSVADFMAAIASRRAVIAGRFHAAVAAILAGKPVIALAYHHKFDALRLYGTEAVPVSTILGPRLSAVSPTTGFVEHDTRERVRQEFRSACRLLGGQR